MIDLSRGAVYKPEFLKKIIRYASQNGISSISLYTEFFEIEEYPETLQLVKKEGQLKRKEIEDLVYYGLQNNVELFPSVETLAHLEKLLETGAFEHIRLGTSETTINPLSFNTYEFLKTYIARSIEPYRKAYEKFSTLHPAARKMFRKINVGCDETVDIENKETYVNHVLKVKQICDEHGLTCIMWADMIPKLNLKQTKKLKGIEFIYWEYDVHTRSHIDKVLRVYDSLGITINTVAASTLSHCQFIPFGKHARKVAQTLFAITKEKKIPSFWITVWGDDSTEAPFILSLPTISETTGNNDTSAYFGEERSYFLLLEKLNYFDPRVANAIAHPHNPNPLKVLVYEDPRFIPFTSRVNYGYGNYFAKLTCEIKELLPKIHEENLYAFNYAFALSEYLEIKADFGKKLRTIYTLSKEKGVVETVPLISEIDTILFKLQALKSAHQTAWNAERKSGGFKRIADRYASLQKAFVYLKEDLEKYITKGIFIDYLEKQPPKVQTNFPMSYWKFYKDITALPQQNYSS